MKKSDELKQQQAEVDNDLAALGLGKQIIREERNERWEDKWLPRFKQLFEDKIEYLPAQSCWRMTINDEIYDYYPKANKLHHHARNTWHTQGLKFLIKKFIK